MNKLVVLATVFLIGAHGDPDPQEREVNSLQSLQQQQPAPSWNPYGGAQGFANPYMRNYGQPQPIYGQPQPTYGQPQPTYGQPQPTYGQPQPTYGQPMGNPYNSFPQMPSFGVSGGLGWGGYQVGGSAGYYPNDYYHPNHGVESSTSKPNYEYEDDEEDEPKSGVEIVESGNNQQNSGLNWNQPQPSWNQPWNGGMSYGPPSWSSSYTPVGGGCYNRCKPSCSFRPPSPPPPPLPQPIRPRPRPLPMPMPRPQPMPLPQPARPNYGCRSVCRPMCNRTPSCGAGAEFNGNTMVCGSNKPSYNQGLQYGGMYGNYGNYNSMYGGMMTTLPAKDPRSQPKAAKSVEAEAVVPSEEKKEEES